MIHIPNPPSITVFVLAVLLVALVLAIARRVWVIYREERDAWRDFLDDEGRR